MASLSLGRSFANAATRRAAGTTSRGSTSRNFSAIFSMTDEYPDLPSVSPVSLNNAATSTTTVLDSGLTVVTEDSSSTSSLVLTFPSAGSGNETPEYYDDDETGAALINKCLAYKSGSGLSSALILRSLENDGAKTFSTVNRSSAQIGFTCAPDRAAKLLPLLNIQCSFENWDVKEAMNTAKVLVEQAHGNAQTLLTEQLYSAAFGPQSNLGKSLYSANPCSPAGILSFRERCYGLNGAILSATGVSDHDAFLQQVEVGFATDTNGTTNTKSPPPPSITNAAYMGGEARLSAPSTNYTHLALAFDNSATTSVALSNVMKYCLSLSSDKTTNNTTTSFVTPGLIGLYSSAPSTLSTTSLLDSISSVLTSSLTDELVTRAKTLAKAEALLQLENGTSVNLAQQMTMSVLENNGTTFCVSAIKESYDSITKQDVSKAMGMALKTNPAAAALGDLSNVPYQASIANRFS